MTDGAPSLSREGNFHRLDNMLIGNGFHWQRPISVLLPGEIIPHDGTGISLLNRLPVEQYLECVVGSEMNPLSPPEFLKAHAIISRSWAVGKVLRSHTESSEGKKNEAGEIIDWNDTADHSGFDVCSDDHCQRYQGIQPISEAALRAIRESAGQVLVDKDGAIVDARFSKCCGGRTEIFSTCWQDREISCLESFEDPWCDLTSLSCHDRETALRSVLKDYDLSTDGGYRWKATVSKKDIARNLREKFGRDIGKIKAIRPLETGFSGRIRLLEVSGESGILRIGKELMIRRLLAPTHLLSSAFEAEDNGDDIMLHGRGWGHGVGLCQIGAAAMALSGKSAGEILSFYYPGSKIAPIAETAENTAIAY